jgi:TM2 domain-containing membrane protein YozV
MADVQSPSPIQASGSGESKKMMIAILAILLGSFGVHRFMLGDTTGGLIRIAITVVTCGAGGIIGLIEGIIYITKSDADFHQIYEVQKKGWF